MEKSTRDKLKILSLNALIGAGAIFLLALFTSCAPSLLERAAKVPSIQAHWDAPEGDSALAHLEDLTKRLESWGVTVRFDSTDPRYYGLTAHDELAIYVDQTQSVNAQFEILAHEGAHLVQPPAFRQGHNTDVAEVFVELVAEKVLKWYGYKQRSTEKWLAAYKAAFPQLKYFAVDIDIAYKLLTGQLPAPKFNAHQHEEQQ